MKLQQCGSCQVYVLIPQKTWQSLPLTCQLVKQGTRAQHTACTGCKILPERRQSKHLRWENLQSWQVTTKLLDLQLTTKRNVNQSLYLLIYKPYTHSSAHNFYHPSYISSATLAQKVSLNAQELSRQMRMCLLRVQRCSKKTSWILESAHKKSIPSYR